MPIKRVVLIGAESTGKTTLAEALAAHYGTVWAPEYLRAFVEEKGALPEPGDTVLIARGHRAQEARLIPQARRVLFYDTDLISTCVYSRYYFGACPRQVEQWSYQRHADLYLLTDIDIPWTADPGQRDGPAVRAALHALFQKELQARGVARVVVSGTPEARMTTAVQAVDGLLRSV
jgi:NadR type nicotinamide-nucleotide adenylyltransferase